MSESVRTDDWPRPRFQAAMRWRFLSGREVWGVFDRVYCFALIAQGPEWEMEDLADDLEERWLDEDARVAEMAA